jgi:uncharacterized protein (DUF111 family)
MLLMVNVDDISGELIPHVIDGLMARGAGNVHVLHSLTKKGRLEYLFLIDAPETAVDGLGAFLASELGTLGIRVFDTSHIRFEYRFCQVRLLWNRPDSNQDNSALVRVKQILNHQGEVVSVKAEFDDLRQLVNTLEDAGKSVSLSGLKRIVEQAALRQDNVMFEGIKAEYEQE